MTLNSTYAVTPLTPDEVSIAWSASSASDRSWVFVNGRSAAGPVASSSAARSATVRVAVGRTAAIEVHDMSDGSAPEPTWAEPNTRPRFKWAALVAAQAYRLYQTKPGQAEELAQQVAADAAQARLELRAPEVLDGQGGQWHRFRVEAVDASGLESTRLAWPYFVMEPPAPAILDVADGSAPNLFDLTIGA